MKIYNLFSFHILEFIPENEIIRYTFYNLMED